MATLSPPPKHRVPRLMYRAKSADDASSIQTLATVDTRTTVETLAPTISTTSASSVTSPSEEVPSSGGSLTPSTALGRDKRSKRKRDFFTSLFTAREPSAQALAEYEKQLKQASATRGRSTVALMPGISPARLPPTVPKVNSKWDGLPQSMQKKQDTRERSGSSTPRSNSPGRSETSLERAYPRRPKSRDTLGTTSTGTGGSQNRLATLYGWQSAENSNDHLNQDGAADMTRGRAARKASNRSFSGHRPAAATAVPDMPSIEACKLAGQATSPASSRSPSLTLCNSSPATPGEISLKAPILKVLKYASPIGTPSTSSGAPSPATSVIVVSSGPHILGPPTSLKQGKGASAPVSRPPIGSHTSSEQSTENVAHVNEKDGSDQKGTKAATHRTHRRVATGAKSAHSSKPSWMWRDPSPDSGAKSGPISRIASPSPVQGSLAIRQKRHSLHHQ